MALIFEGKSKCSICNKVLKTNENFVIWSAFLNSEHKFWKFSDTGMHQECYNQWEHKDEFEHFFKYQPLIDFDDAELKEKVKKNGMPDWLEKIKDYRKSKT